MPQITMKEMLDAGVHFGHQTQRWNPKMKPYVYASRGGIHVINLQKSVVYAKKAGDYVREMAASGGKIIFVGTKKQAADIVREAAEKCGQFYVTKRWLGGILTNFSTIKSSIDRLKKIDRMREKGDLDLFSKKERAKIEKEYTKLDEYLRGIKEMKESPTAMFVVDLNKEHIAVAEAKRLGVKVIGIADTNTDPEAIDFPIPGNDDAIRSIKLFSQFISDAFNEGLKDWEVKKLSLEKEEQKVTPVVQTTSTAPAGGPAVVKMSKGRKLVAAGLAEDVEIELELASKESGESLEANTNTSPEGDKSTTTTPLSSTKSDEEKSDQ